MSQLLINNAASLSLQFPESFFLEYCRLPDLGRELKEYIKFWSSNAKMYKENCLLMQIAQVLSPEAKVTNICCKKTKQQLYRIKGVICQNGYILLPRSPINAFQKLTGWFFNHIMQPDISVYHQDLCSANLWKGDKMHQKNALKFLNDIKRTKITPLLIIEEESSTMHVTAQSLAAKLVEQYRLIRAQSSSANQVTGFAFPAPETCDYDLMTATDFFQKEGEGGDDDDVYDDDDDDDDDEDRGGRFSLEQSVLCDNFRLSSPTHSMSTLTPKRATASKSTTSASTSSTPVSNPSSTPVSNSSTQASRFKRSHDGVKIRRTAPTKVVLEVISALVVPAMPPRVESILASPIPHTPFSFSISPFSFSISPSSFSFSLSLSSSCVLFLFIPSSQIRGPVSVASGGG